MKASRPWPYVHALAGRQEPARAILAAEVSAPGAPRLAVRDRGDPHRLGEVGAVLDWLETAHRERDRALVRIKVYPRLDPLRDEPRLQELCDKLA